MKFLKNITAEHAALLAIGVNSYSDLYNFTETLEHGNLCDEFVFLDDIKQTKCTIENIDRIKNYLSLLIDAIHFEMNEYIKYIQSCDSYFEYDNCDPFDRPDTPIYEPKLNTKVEVTDIKMKRSSLFLGAPFDNGTPTEPDLQASLLDKTSIANWLVENKELDMARRIDSKVIIKGEFGKETMKEIKQLEHSMASVDTVSELLRNIPTTNKNIKLFKSQLSEDWREALFLHKLSTDMTVIAELKQQISAQNKQINELKENTFPVMTPKLKAALKAQNEFWSSYDEKKIPSQQEISNFIAEKLGLTVTVSGTNRTADELAKAIQPDHIKRK